MEDLREMTLDRQIERAQKFFGLRSADGKGDSAHLSTVPAATSGVPSNSTVRRSVALGVARRQRYRGPVCPPIRKEGKK